MSFNAKCRNTVIFEVEQCLGNDNRKMKSTANMFDDQRIRSQNRVSVRTRDYVECGLVKVDSVAAGCQALFDLAVTGRARAAAIPHLEFVCVDDVDVGVGLV